MVHRKYDNFRFLYFELRIHINFTFSITAVPNLFGTRDWFCGRQFFRGVGVGWGDDGSGGNVSDGEWQMKLCLLTSCCEAWFLRGRGQVNGPGVGDPCFIIYLYL